MVNWFLRVLLTGLGSRAGSRVDLRGTLRKQFTKPVEIILSLTSFMQDVATWDFKASTVETDCKVTCL